MPTAAEVAILWELTWMRAVKVAIYLAIAVVLMGIGRCTYGEMTNDRIKERCLGMGAVWVERTIRVSGTGAPAKVDTMRAEVEACASKVWSGGVQFVPVRP
jgi:hypothetical protein